MATGRHWRPLIHALLWIMSRNADDVNKALATGGIDFKLLELERLLPVRDQSGALLGNAPLSSQSDVDKIVAIIATSPLHAEQDAWESLRDAICDERVKARAKWMDRRQFVADGERLWQVTTAPAAEALPAAAVEGYVLWEEGARQGKIAIAPENAVMSNWVGRYWTAITIHWGDLLAAFPAQAHAVEASAVTNGQSHGTRRRGRVKGSGQFEGDKVLIAKMEKLRNLPKGDPERLSSRYAAAMKLSPLAEGSTEGDSTVRRLERKHKAEFPGDWN